MTVSPLVGRRGWDDLVVRIWELIMHGGGMGPNVELPNILQIDPHPGAFADFLTLAVVESDRQVAFAFADPLEEQVFAGMLFIEACPKLLFELESRARFNQELDAGAQNRAAEIAGDLLFGDLRVADVFPAAVSFTSAVEAQGWAQVFGLGDVLPLKPEAESAINQLLVESTDV